MTIRLLFTVGLLAMEIFLLAVTPSPLVAVCTVVVACCVLIQLVLAPR